MIVTLDMPKTGALVGTDALGNEYYENRADPFSRDRWVIYDKWNYDPTQVPPEWHQWLHRMTDDLPDKLPTPFYTPAHLENLTGTTAAFKTYSTVKPKYEAWTGTPKSR